MQAVSCIIISGLTGSSEEAECEAVENQFKETIGFLLRENSIVTNNYPSGS